MLKSITKHTPEIILLIYLLLFFGIKKPYNEWDRVINSDGKGYYGYLTAIFIYNDLDYNFVDHYEKKYYPEDGSAYKEFVMPVEGDMVNKTFPGLALLWLPFFLLAHFLSFLFGFETDGYSVIYQYSIGIATLFYLWLGFKFLFRILQKFNMSTRIISFVLFLIAFGTNIIYYAIVESSMAHIYSFALISGFIYAIIKAIEKHNTWWWVLAATFLSLAIITRPTNGIFIFLIPFIAGSFKSLKQLIIVFLKNYKALVLSALISGIILFIPILLWYLQTGQFIVYSYGEEGFNFLDPHFFSILFSFNKGWFLYTPIAFVAMYGFISIYKQNKFRFFVLFILLSVHIYIASSWWVWHYTSKFSQRVFIDFYAVVAILLTYLLVEISRKKIISCFIYVILSILLVFNLFQFYQHYKWIFPYGDITKEIYWDAFSSTVAKARVSIPEGKILETESVQNDFENKLGWNNESSIVNYNGENNVSVSDSSNIFSVEFRDNYLKYFASEKGVIKISADIFSNKKFSGASLVTEFQVGYKPYSYNSFFIKSYNKQNKWVHIENAVYTPESITSLDFVKIFFYNPDSTEVLMVDNLEIEFISVINEKSSIDNVSNPVTTIKQRKKKTHEFENNIEGWSNYETVSSEKVYRGNKSCKINKMQPFSISFEGKTIELFSSENKVINVKAMIFAKYDINEARFIIDLKNGENTVSYNAFEINKFFQTLKWSAFEQSFLFPDLEVEIDNIKIYFWSPSKDEELYIDNIEYEFISF